MSPAETLRIDFNGVKGPRKAYHRTCVSAGRAGEGLRAEWQRQLRRVKADCGFHYIRFHGLYFEDMGVYAEDKQGNPVYNFQYIDHLFDFLREIGMRPFVELGLMPAALASGPATAFWWKHNVSPPKCWERWAELVRRTVVHFVDRYGIDEVRQWYFEVWNEPNLKGFWSGSMEEYLKLYAVTAHAVKGVDAALRVGGPASAGNGFTKELLDYCDREDVPLDFISNHGYGVKQTEDVWGKVVGCIDPRPEAILESVRQTHAWIQASKHPEREFHFTEFNSSWFLWDNIRDSYFNAPYILYKLKQFEPYLDSLSYWTFTDIYEEAAPPKTPFPGLYGMMNVHGLRKPSYYTWKFLHELGDTQLACADEQAWATRSTQGVQVLFWNLTFPRIIESNQSYFGREQPTLELPPREVVIENLPAGNYDLEATRTGYRSNDVLTDYYDLGKPAELSREQVASLDARNNGSAFFLGRVQHPGGTFRHKLPMRENDVVLFKLRHRS